MDNNSELYSFLLAQNGAGFLQNHPSSICGSSSSSYYHHPFEVVGVSNNYSINGETMTSSPEDRAIAALKNHKEAEKRRRERINSHLDKLRTLLPCNSKTDKASLLAKVVERVKELKQETLEIPHLETFPSETDDVSVVSGGHYSSDGSLIFKASICCDDRSDLLTDLIQMLKSLRLRTLRAEMATIGGRTRNVLIIAADKDHSIESVQLLQNGLKSLVDRSSSSSSDRSKRRRMILDHDKILV